MTNNKDYLSQEEIDALLRQAAGSPDFGGSSSPPAIGDYLSALEQDALGEIGNITFGSAATALSTLLGKKVDITTPKVSVIPRDELRNEFPKPHVAVHVKYVEGFHGINLLVIKSRDAQVIADLMMGGQGEVQEGELSEIHISAVQEAMNQMMGSSATSMSTIFNRFVNISPPGIDVLDFQSGSGENNIPEEDVFIKVSFRLMIGDLIDSTLMQLLPVAFAKDMVRTLMGDMGESSAPVPAVELPEPDPRNHPAPSPTSAPSGSPLSEPPEEADVGVPNRQVNVRPVQFADLRQSKSAEPEEGNLGLLLDIPLKVTVELGRTSKMVKDILELSQGSIIELDKLAGEPVDILVNNKFIAKGEVVVIDENFGVRVTDIVNHWDRIQKLQ